MKRTFNLTVMAAGLALATGAALADGGARRTVRLGPGLNALDKPMALTAADSGTRYVGASDGSTVLSGGLKITGWTARADGVWAAKAPFFFETLFVNGRRAVRAREPNKGYFHVREIVRGTNGLVRALGLLPPQAALVAKVPAADLPFVHLNAHMKWALQQRPLAGFDAAKGCVSFADISDPKWNRMDPKEQYCLENLRSAFDAPGEWFYDGTAGEVLYRPLPGERIGRIEAIAPRQGFATLVTLDGAEDVTFENVMFAHSTPSEETGPSSHHASQGAMPSPATVLANDSRRLVFRNCAFRHTGGYALHLAKNCTSNLVASCWFEDLGAGGVKIGPFDGMKKDKLGAAARPPAGTAFNTVTNCVFRHGGRFRESGIGVFIGHASDNVIVKNTIEDFYYTGISVGWVWGYGGSVAQRNQIGYNRISRIGQKVLSDMGGIYTLGTSFGTRIFNNVISDVDSLSYGGWGIYPDEGSEGVVIENNLVYDTMDASFHQHYGRGNVLRNNILCFSRQCQVAVTRVEPHLSVSVEGNILLWEKGDAFGARYPGIRDGAKVAWTNNVWWCTGGEPRFNGKTYAQWRAGGRDAGGQVADPCFVDAAKRDFRLKRGSPALKAGFRAFDPSEAGSSLAD